MIDFTKPAEQAPEFVEYARVHCRHCDDMPLSQEMYRAEMMRPDSRWSCPQCGGVADFDDALWEELHYPNDAE